MAHHFRAIDSDFAHSLDANELQNDLNTVTDWAQAWQMKFNVSKCSILRIHRLQNPIINSYTVMNEELTAVKHHPYLGVELDQKLSFTNHIDNVTAKATRTLNLLRRNLKHCPPKVKEQAYHTLVRPQLEYSSSEWDQSLCTSHKPPEPQDRHQFI